MANQQVVCPECPDDAEYTIDLVYTSGDEFATGASPWDEPGTSHRAPESKRVNYYRCSNGHSWTVEE